MWHNLLIVIGGKGFDAIRLGVNMDTLDSNAWEKPRSACTGIF